MRLLHINDSYEVEIDKEWLLLIPEFAELIRRDKGSQGDYRGDKKLRAKKELAYIYFMLDFTSPIRDWEEEERRKEALKYTGLEEKKVMNDQVLAAAYDKYDEILIETAPEIRTIRALRKGLKNLDDYYENIDFTTKDRTGKLVNTAESYIKGVTSLSKMYESIDGFEKRVMDKLKGTSGVRGKATLGYREKLLGSMNIAPTWGEKGAPQDQGRKMVELGELVKLDEEDNYSTEDDFDTPIDDEEE